MKIIKGMIKSKTLWGNLIAIAVLIYTTQVGEPVPELPAEMQTSILAIFNMVIRLFTTKSISEKGC